MTFTGRSSRAARCIVAALLAGLAGCSTAGSQPATLTSSLPPPPSAPPASAPTATASPAESPPSVPPASATPLPDVGDPPPVPLGAVTLICESWGSDPPASTIPCREAASRALAALGSGLASRVARLDVSFSGDCQARASCPSRRPDLVWVVARSPGRDAELLKVERAASGALEAWPPTPAPSPPAPPFDPPARVAPDLGPDSPAALRDRVPYPFCGDEDVGPSGAFDAPARRCFADGVLAASPVELISRSPSTEGDPVLTLYRFGGRGSVVRSVHAGDTWTTAVCGISPIATDAAFTVAGGCDPLPP